MSFKIVKQNFNNKEDCSSDIKKKLKEKNIYMINVMGSPGAGKTSLIIELIDRLRDEFNIAIIEGDIAGQVDAEKIDAEKIPVIQLNLNGACHIEPTAIRDVLGFFDLNKIDLIIVENIGNLVCPAEFDIGEDLRIAVLSIPEGDDKVEKYPLLFSKSEILVLSKYDTIEYFNFDEKKAISDMGDLNKSFNVFKTSNKTGKDFDLLSECIKNKIKNKNFL